MPETENLNLDLKKMDISLLKYIKGHTGQGDSEKYKAFLSLFSFVEKMLLFWSLEKRSFTGFSPSPTRNIVEEILARRHFKDLQNFFKETGINIDLTNKNIGGIEQLFLNFRMESYLSFLLPVQQE